MDSGGVLWAARMSATGTTAGPVPAPVPAGSSLAISVSAMMTAGAVSSIAWAISSALHHRLPGATTAPSRRPAHSEITHSGELAASNSSRSPGPRPRAARCPATRPAAAAIAANVTRRRPWTRWSRSAQRAASSSSSVTRRRRC